MGKKVISFCLFKDRPKDSFNAIANCFLSPGIYPGWICRFYVDETVPKGIVDLMRTFDHVEVVEMPRHRGSEAMLWRFLPASDSDVDVFISRDCDSWVSTREAVCVDEWLKSNKNFHIIRDHCYHINKIMGGMWGCRNHILPEMRELVEEFSKNNTYDQGFLAEYIYPKVLDTAMIHLSEHIHSDTYLTPEQYAAKYEGRSCPYPRDGGILMPPYKNIEIDEYVKGLSFNKIGYLNNNGKCGHCHELHLTFVGAILQYMNLEMLQPMFERMLQFGISRKTITYDETFMWMNVYEHSFYFIIANNNSFPIEFQFKQLKKYIQEPFNVIIINGGDCSENVNKINGIAEGLNCLCYGMPVDTYHDDKQLIRDPTRAYAACMNFVINEIIPKYVKKFNTKYVAISHPDVFPVKNVSFYNILNTKPMAITLESKQINNKLLEYIFPLLLVMDINTVEEMNTLNFNNVYIKDNNDQNIPLDCGGCTHTYVTKYKNKLTVFDNTEVQHLHNSDSDPNLDEKTKSFFSELKKYHMDNKIENTGSYCIGFYHFITGSRWVHRNGFDLKMGLIKKYYD